MEYYMTIDENYLELIHHDNTLNKAQSKILDLPFPLEDTWAPLILGKELSTKDTNLLILLKGKLALKTQDQIIKNYETLSSFRNPKKTESVKQKEVEEYLRNESKVSTPMRYFGLHYVANYMAKDNTGLLKILDDNGLIWASLQNHPKK